MQEEKRIIELELRKYIGIPANIMISEGKPTSIFCENIGNTTKWRLYFFNETMENKVLKDFQKNNRCYLTDMPMYPSTNVLTMKSYIESIETIDILFLDPDLKIPECEDVLFIFDREKKYISFSSKFIKEYVKKVIIMGKETGNQKPLKKLGIKTEYVKNA